MKHTQLLLSVSLFLALILPLSGQASEEITGKGKIKIAACQFPISADIAENATWIMDQMLESKQSGAEIVHFPECALTGYPGTDLKTLEDFDWKLLNGYTDSIIDLARELKIWVLLGSIHQLGENYKPMNSLYVINPEGQVIERYDKRFCTSGDLKYFSAGEHLSVFEMNGVKCGLLICFDVRYPELYREYRKMDVDVLFQSFYNARQKPGGIHPKIMPVTAQARAGTNHFYMSLTNSSAPNSWPCHFITPDGLIETKLDPNVPAILFSEIDLSEKFYDASRHFRDNALEGKLSSGESPDHPRYKDRQGR